jgi:hypothetical protein
MHNGQPPSTISMTTSPFASPSVIDYDFAPQFNNQFVDQANDFLAHGNLTTTEYSNSEFDFAGYTSNGETELQLYWNPQLLTSLSNDHNSGEIPFTESPFLSPNWQPSYTI